METPKAQLEVHKHSMVGVVIRRVIEDTKSLVEFSQVFGVGRVDVEDSTRGQDFGVRIRRNGRDNRESRGTPVPRGPEKAGAFGPLAKTYSTSTIMASKDRTLSASIP